MSKKHIVVADDQPGVRRLLSEILKKDKYEMHEAGSGEEVMDILGKKKADLVLLDVKMPRLDGVMTLKQILELPDPPPVIMMTAQGQADLGKRVMDMGATAYLEKPFDINMVLKLVDKIVH